MQADVSGWADHKLSRSFRSLLRQAEKRIGREKKEETIRLQNLVYDLKKAIIQEDEDKALELQDLLMDELEWLEERD